MRLKKVLVWPNLTAKVKLVWNNWISLLSLNISFLTKNKNKQKTKQKKIKKQKTAIIRYHPVAK